MTRCMQTDLITVLGAMLRRLEAEDAAGEYLAPALVDACGGLAAEVKGPSGRSLRIRAAALKNSERILAG